MECPDGVSLCSGSPMWSVLMEYVECPDGSPMCGSPMS